MAFVPTNVSNTVSSANTTTTPLGIGATFTGGWVDVSNVAEIKLSYTSDVDGGAQFWVDFSTDGTTVESSLPLHPTSNASQLAFGGLHTLNPTKPYFRTRYINGAEAQTTFSLVTLLGGSYGGGLVSRSGQVIGPNTDVTLVRAVNDVQFDRTLGLVADQENIRKFGQNTSVSNSAYETVWSGSTLYTYPQTAETLQVRAGGNINDTAAGSGARRISVEFLDANWDRVTEELVLAGASASAATSSTAIRVIRAKVVETGTYHGTNAGNILIENSTSGTLLAQISTGFGQTQLCAYSVPRGYTAYIRQISVSVGEGDSATVRLVVAENGNDVTVPYTNPDRVLWNTQNISGQVIQQFQSLIPLPEYTDVRMDAIRVTGSGQAQVSAEFSFTLVRNEA